MEETARRNIPFDPISVSAANIGEVVDPDQSYISIELPNGYSHCSPPKWTDG